jgi:hypothetical protein
VAHEQGGVFLVLLRVDLLDALRLKLPEHIGPTFVRQRCVWVDRTKYGDLYLRCTCGLYERELRPCRHMLAVKNGHVDVCVDVHPHYAQGHSLAKDGWVANENDGTADGPSPRGVLPGTEVGEWLQNQNAGAVCLLGCVAYSKLTVHKLPGLTPAHLPDEEPPVRCTTGHNDRYHGLLEQGNAHLKRVASMASDQNLFSPAAFTAVMEALEQHLEALMLNVERIQRNSVVIERPAQDPQDLEAPPAPAPARTTQAPAKLQFRVLDASNAPAPTRNEPRKTAQGEKKRKRAGKSADNSADKKADQHAQGPQPGEPGNARVRTRVRTSVGSTGSDQHAQGPQPDKKADQHAQGPQRKSKRATAGRTKKRSRADQSADQRGEYWIGPAWGDSGRFGYAVSGIVNGVLCSVDGRVQVMWCENGVAHHTEWLSLEAVQTGHNNFNAGVERGAQVRT